MEVLCCVLPGQLVVSQVQKAEWELSRLLGGARARADGKIQGNTVRSAPRARPQAWQVLINGG